MTTNPDIPFRSAVRPELLRSDSQIRFHCHKGISCFNACCKQGDVTLAPYDILRLKRRFGLTATEFLRDYTLPFQMDGDGLPGVKLKTDDSDSGACLLLDGENGCGLYADRPTVCRYYPLALLALREKSSPDAEERYSLVEEPHCRGHAEPRLLSVAEYRAEQGCESFDAMNREWYQLILKKKSAGPSVGRPPETSFQLFFMASYDIDRFRRFVLSENFRNTYPLPDDVYVEFERDDESLLRFSYRFLRQVLFGERTIPEAADAWARRIEQRKEVWDARRRMALDRRMAAEDRQYDDGGDETCAKP